MYAVIQTGGKQYRVSEGDVLRVETLEAEPQAKLTFDQVLLVDKGGDVLIGKPVIAGASVEAEVIRHGRHKKVIIYKKMKRSTYQRTNGHRQNYTEVRIKGIKA